ncbi:hypothetical protein DESC_870041 [Desulfosarcina cetonica]|nr:hypothetical protein DESC_870041 [Desulfosarcina cetonica]
MIPKRTTTHPQYHLFPFTANSSMLTSHDVVDGRFRSQDLFPSDGVVFLQQFPHFRMLVVQIAESDGTVGGLHAGGLEADGQPLRAEVAFFNHTLHAGGEFLVVVLDKGPRIPEVEAAGTKRTGSHAETTTDAAMEVHHHDSVIVLERRLGGAGPDAGWILAMVAQQEERPILDIFVEKIVGLVGKGVVVVGFPDPFDLVILVLDLGRNIMDLIARRDNRFQRFGRLQFAGIDHHGPLLGRHGLLTLGDMIARPLCIFRSEGIEYGFCPKTQRGNASYLKKASSAVIHTYSPFGLSMWQSQQ